MNLAGYNIGRSVKYKTWEFSGLSQPFFKAGNAVGCLVLHGFTGTPASVRPLSEGLADRGYTVYAPLLSGHGTTLADMHRCTGEDWLNDVRAGYEKLRASGCEQIVLLGFSMGGILAALTAQEHECAGLVLINAPLRMRQYIINATKFTRLVPFVEYRPKREKHPVNRYAEGYRGLATEKLKDLQRLTVKARGGLYKITCPVLVLQSGRDNRVDPVSVDITRYGVGSKDVRFVLLKDSPHSCVYGPEKVTVIAKCLEFIQDITKDYGWGNN